MTAVELFKQGNCRRMHGILRSQILEAKIMHQKFNSKFEIFEQKLVVFLIDATI